MSRPVPPPRPSSVAYLITITTIFWRSTASPGEQTVAAAAAVFVTDTKNHGQKQISFDVMHDGKHSFNTKKRIVVLTDCL